MVPVVANLARLLLSTQGKRLAFALKNISRINRLKTNPRIKNKPARRTIDQRQEDAMKLARLFLKYLEASIMGDSFGYGSNKPKSPFTKLVQDQRRSRTPLLYTGRLYSFRGTLTKKYVSIIKRKIAVDVGFEVNKFYDEEDLRPKLVKTRKYPKPIKVSLLLRILEKGASIPYSTGSTPDRSGRFVNIRGIRKSTKMSSTERGFKVHMWFIKVMLAMGLLRNSKFKAAKGSEYSNKKKAWKIPPRPFWDRAVAQFTKKYSRKGIVIRKKFYRISIEVTE